MRFIEILLLVSLVPLVLWPLLPLRRWRWQAVLPAAALLFLLLHIVFEGYRWQMIPAYGLTAVYALISFIQLSRPAQPGVPTVTWKTAVGGLAGLVVLLLAFALPTLLPVPNLSPKTGPYPVGTTTLHLVDDSREEIYTPESGDFREIMVQFWYPAAPTGQEEQAIFLPDLAFAGPVIAEQFNLPTFMLNHINLAKLDITQDPPAVNGRFPIIIFSHGLTGLRVQNTSMARELASHGYVVAAIDHTYANAISVLPDERIFIYDPCRLFPECDASYVNANPLVNQWAADIAFVLDTMSHWDETTSAILAGKLDVDRVGVFGHSTGGGATVQFCLDDARCDAGLGLDAWVLPVDARVLATPPAQPFLFISTPRWLGPENQARGRAILNALPGDGYELTLAETGHFDFSDIVLLSPLTPQLGISGEIDSLYSLGIQNEYVLAFFDQYVKGEERPLLSQPSPFPELTIARP